MHRTVLRTAISQSKIRKTQKEQSSARLLLRQMTKHSIQQRNPLSCPKRTPSFSRSSRYSGGPPSAQALRTRFCFSRFSESVCCPSTPCGPRLRPSLRSVVLPKMLSDANAFEISGIEEVETEARLARRSECNNVTLRRKPLNGTFGRD